MEPRRTLNLTHLGWGLAVPVLFLVSVGLASIHATDRSVRSADVAVGTGWMGPPSPPHWSDRVVSTIGPQTLKQSVYLAAGVVLFWVVLRLSYQRIGRYAFAIYWIVIGMLGLLLADRYVIDMPFIPEIRNTHRWIKLGEFTLQPSELMKLALVLALARYLRFRTSYRTWRGLVPPFLLTLLPMALILKQPDLGTLLMLLPVLFAMLFVAGARMRHLATIIVLGVATLPVFYFAGMQSYQRDRILVLFRQGSGNEDWNRKEGYQLRQSKIALGMGGVTGEGFGEGAFVRYELLPEEHNDFIFAIIGNQWGLIGCALVILAYVSIVFVGVEIATVTNDPFGRLLAIGVIVMIVAQALLNMCMTIGLAPITGMPLPFVSAGGSSLWTNLAALGLLVSVAQRRPMLIANPPFEHAND